MGKAISSRNNTKHGFYSTDILLPGESSEDFNGLEKTYFRVFKPLNPVEEDLVRDAIHSRWTYLRMVALEKQAFLDGDAKFQLTEEYFTAIPDRFRFLLMKFADEPRGSYIDRIISFKERSSRSFHRALQRLERLRKTGTLIIPSKKRNAIQSSKPTSTK